jgi:beta-glucanase (GH16 family)
MLRERLEFCPASISVAALALAVAVAFTAAANAQAVPKAATASKAKLVWADEFNGPDGSSLDSRKWTALDNGSGFGNNEQEYYTPRTANVHVEKGNLVLTAIKEPYTGKDGARNYTSGRIETRDKFELQYGRVEARIKMPKGQGIWPAFWMLGSDFLTHSWPECGEIDIMENIGSEPGMIHGSLHGPGYSGGNPLTGVYTLPNHERFSEGFHVFAAEWQPGEIRFYVDGHLFETQKAADLPAGKRWVFDHPFFVLFNLAVGGYWPGQPDTTTTFPQTMLVDYVRVYKLHAPQKAAQR